MTRDPELTLRPATPADREFLMEVYASTRADEMRLLNWDDRTASQFLRLQFEARERSYRNTYPEGTTAVVQQWYSGGFGHRR